MKLRRTTAATRTAEMEVERLRSVLSDIATHAGAMTTRATTSHPSTNMVGFQYLAALATDALER